MSKVNPAFDVDIGSPGGHMPVRSRKGGGHALEKAPHAFPDLLDGINLSKNTGGNANQAFDNIDKNVTRQVDAGKKAMRQSLSSKEKTVAPANRGAEKLELPKTVDDVAKYLQNLVAIEQTAEPECADEEKILEPKIPDDVTKYLQSLIAINQMPASSGELVPHAETAADNISTLIATINADAKNPASANQDKPHSVSVQTRAKEDVRGQDVDKDVMESAAVPNVGVASAIHSPDRELAHQIESHIVEIQVLKIETSFAPAAPVSLVTQFSKAVVDGLQGAGQNTSPIAGNVVPDPRRDIVKSIQLRLHPEDLGEIKVAMHLRGDELRLKIEVTSRQVETLLLRDHQVLKDLIGQAGYDVSDASILITHTPDPLALPLRDMVTVNSNQDPSVGQGYRQHPGTSEESREQFQSMRGGHGAHPESDGEDNAKIRQVEPPNSGRGGGIYI